MRLLVRLMVTVASSLALTLPQNETESGQLSYPPFRPECDRPSGAGIDFRDCYVLVLMDQHRETQNEKFTWWKYEGGHNDRGYRHLPWPSVPIHHGRAAAQLDIPVRQYNTYDTFSLADVKSSGMQIAEECCKHGQGGSIKVAHGVVTLKIFPWHRPAYLQMPGDAQASVSNSTV